MRKQTIQCVEILRPHFTEASAKESVEKKRGLAFLHKPIRWISAVPLYLPFWLVSVEMDLLAPKRGTVQNTYPILVNALTNRGMQVKGKLDTVTLETQAIFMEPTVDNDTAQETARIEALVDTKRMIKPPPHRVLPGARLIWYPLALVQLERGGREEVQIFDYYRGGLDKYTMRFFKLKEKLVQKEQQTT